jgi:rhodanese-related sulfurtransferase
MRTLYQMLAIAGLVALAAIATWQIKGPPLRKVPCDPSKLIDHEVCLDTVMQQWHGDVVWVDARRRSDWEKDGVPGSLFITNAKEENFDELLAQSVEKLAVGKKVIVYCTDIGCGTSLEVAKRIRDFQLVPEVKALHGGWKALDQAGLTKKSK